MEIRFATAADSSQLLKIYGQYIDTSITFEYVLPTEQEFTKRILDISQMYPYLVCLEGGEIIGYAYAHRQMQRAAYQWNAELSIYLDRCHTSRGIGKLLYCCLMDLLKLQGVKTVYGGVTLPNEKSERLHQALGFRQLGIYRNTGYKCGSWHDVAWFEKQIAPMDALPSPIVSIGCIPQGQLDALLRLRQKERQ